jgi:hypothetical protein
MSSTHEVEDKTGIKLNLTVDKELQTTNIVF